MRFIVLFVIFVVGILLIFSGANAQAEWDKSSVTSNGITCDGAIVEFSVLNHGSDMTGTSTWEFYENSTFVISNTYQLMSSEVMTLTEKHVSSLCEGTMHKRRDIIEISI